MIIDAEVDNMIRNLRTVFGVGKADITVYNCDKQVHVPLRRWMRWCMDYNTTELHYSDQAWEGVPL